MLDKSRIWAYNIGTELRKERKQNYGYYHKGKELYHLHKR